jgi:hypothetical protein
MSLIIISEPKNKNGNYEITEEKLRELIQEAYDKGYKDGQAKPKYELQPYTLPGNGGLIKQPNINDPFWYERNPTPWWKEVTCDTVPDVNYVPGVAATGTQGSDSTSGGFKGNVETTLLNECCDTEAVNCLHKTELFGGCSCCNIKGEEEKPT